MEENITTETREVWRTEDGLIHLTEDEAREHVAEARLEPALSYFLEERVPSRKRKEIREYLIAFAVYQTRGPL